MFHSQHLLSWTLPDTMREEEPEGWPGVIHREGRTLMRVSERPDSERSGPVSRRSGGVFLNPAMSGSRTRSVLLLDYAMESGMLGDGAVYALDGLSAGGLRARRWLNELPVENARRLDVTISDLDSDALSWAMGSHLEFPPMHGEGELSSSVGDLRKLVLSHGRHWVDIDPFGSPLPFLDSAIQSLARSGVIEVSATDTAALTGSSRGAMLRRYGARVRTDGLAHDSALRVMLASLASNAARHDRCIEPLLSIWDSHHLRVSARVRKSREGANAVEDNLGWRVHSPTYEEVVASIESGLHPNYSLSSLPMTCLLPLSHSVERRDARISGPLWIGGIGDRGAMSSMTEEKAVRLCAPEFVGGDLAEWTERDFEMERRRIVRSVRNLEDEATVIDSAHHILVDDLSSWLGIGSPPSPASMVGLLKEMGHNASLAHYGKPSFRTNANWDDIVEVALGLQPPI